MTSRLGQKAVGVAAVVAIILLIVLIALLWTGVGAGVFSSRSTASTPPQRGFELRTSDSKSRRNQNEDIATIYTSREGLDIVTSTATLLNEKLDDYIKGSERSKGRKLSIDGNDDVSLSHQVEYVKPVKISPLPLHEQDLLYGGDQWAFTSPVTSDSAQSSGKGGRHHDAQTHQPPLRHHSGHFRHKMALLWDPHPQYEFAAFGRHFHLMLAHDSGFVHPELQVTHVWHNMTIRERPGLRPNGCFYTGTVRGDPRSTVAVSLCHGMTGHIRTSTGSYFIEPAENWRDHTTPILHAVYRIPGQSSAANIADEGLHQCGLVDHEDLLAPAAMTLNSSSHPGEQYVGGRARRSLLDHTPRRFPRSYSQEYFIEIMVVADKKMAEYHGDGLYHYILTLMSIVAQIYKDASVGNPVSVAVVKVLILKEMEFVMRDNRRRDAGHDGISAADMLRKFCEWQSSVNTLDDSSPHHHDTALLLTRENICRTPERRKCDTLGLAELGKMCDNNSSCAIVQDNGLSAAFTIAHELGHVLNMPHDDDQKCIRFRDGSKVHNVMSRMLDHKAYPWAWSNCSRHVLTEFLDAGNGRCLLDKPYHDLITAEQERDQSLPGESFTEDRQCQLVFGETSKICSYMPVCKRLWCTTDMGEQAGCRTQYMPWADGTPCKAGRWCQRGECVVKTVLEKVDGNWGNWQPFGECSRTCGGGVKKSVRHCNRPTPANGGRYCTGRRERYRSCGTRDCPPGSKGYREEQCAVFNNNNYNIQGLPEDVKWVPKYGGFSPDERCKLYCRVHGTSAYYPLKEKVVDGTPCGPDTYDMCVNGICKPAGCNHMLGSTMQLDMCGKCGGDNSTCVPIKGSYNNSTYGYTRVVRIPAGSSNLDIRQYGHKGNTDDNYLALVDEDTGEYILNGGFMVSIFRKLLLFGGATLEYTGSQTVVERVNSSSRPLKKDLILEVLSVGSLHPPNITFQYTVQRGTQYRWELRDKWSPCDKVCNGERWQLPICVRMDNMQIVPEEHCAGLSQLHRYTESCNSHCILKWRSWPITECSARCGPGKQTLGLQCVQQFHDSTISDNMVHNSSCAHLLRPSEVIDCEGPCNSTHWEFSLWSQCSKTCGGGIETRTAHCVDERGWPKDEADCKLSDPPVLERPCGAQDCPKWVLGELSPCSVTCGVGERKNSLWCQMGNRIVAPGYCESQPIPHYKETCTREPCASWQLEAWQQCSVTCGTGISVRTVTCRSLDGKEVDASLCSSREKKPISSQTCTKPSCQHKILSSMFPSTSTTTSISLPLGEASHRDNILPTSEPLTDNSILGGNDIPNNVLDEDTKPRSHYRGVWKTSEWGPCSVTCGDGVRHRRVTCMDVELGTPTDKDRCDKTLLVPTEELCRRPICATWKVGEWTPCSATCGKGKSTREVLCLDSLTNTVLPNDRACTDLKLAAPRKEKECDGDCASDASHDVSKKGQKWRTGPWGQCSKSCGTGYMRRVVLCPPDDGNEGEDCNPTDRPVDKILCNIDPCPAWNTGGWSECNESCGVGGYQHRQVRCQSHTGEILADTFCSAPDRPEDRLRCDLPACHINYSNSDHKSITKEYQWAVEPWGKCSKTCGKGERKRRVVCVEVPANANPYQLAGRSQADQQFVRRVGGRHQRLRPRILNETEVVVSSAKCDQRKMPKLVRGCAPQCPFSWSEGEWSECSHDCGKKGRQERHLFCYHREGKKVTRNNCSPALRPHRKRKCNQIRCRFSTCLDIQQKLHAKEDKEYTLQVMGFNVSIYCRGMASDSPQEYISLPAGAEENFSEIYDRRLNHPDDCPYGGERRENCDCMKDPDGKARLTTYSKIRLNITSLRVITQDITFSKEVKGQRLSYGEAGDCYSKVSCPQGRFSINLTGTRFAVSPLTVWEGSGSFPSQKILRLERGQKVTGKCGGYCGTCSPHLRHGLKLDVLPP
ncbi:A disintegrin and metalloproteinase with thrombospondin motifs 9 isoform X2 [Periplaneta americana]|uniref:A disintegrin and metalloproteinase with thrombospondin motifs 9 isoform X2 n=1 Tax=Periplaneta americana TaxID=6978 RepID=UPI0037E8BE9A